MISRDPGIIFYCTSGARGTRKSRPGWKRHRISSSNRLCLFELVLSYPFRKLGLLLLSSHYLLYLGKETQIKLLILSCYLRRLKCCELKVLIVRGLLAIRFDLYFEKFRYHFIIPYLQTVILILYLFLICKIILIPYFHSLFKFYKNFSF